MHQTPELDLSEHGYHELLLLGAGREGQVYRARYSLPVARGLIAPNQRVAIKLTKAAQIRPDEVLIQARIQHRNIVLVLDVFRCTDLYGHDYVATVMELSEPSTGVPALLPALNPGCTLWSMIRKQVEMNMTAMFIKQKTKTTCPVWQITRPHEFTAHISHEVHPSNISHAEPDLRWIFLQTATALDYLHRHPLAIAHRDVKLENMLVFSYNDQHCDNRLRPCVKLSDFGFCMSRSSSSFRTQRAGIDGYSGSQADVWSAGISLFTLATGLRAFHYKPQDRAAIIMQRAASQEHVDRLFKILEQNGASAELGDLLKHMLVINPSKRYSMQQVLKHPWSQKLDADFACKDQAGQPVHPPVWQSMWQCAQSDVREACAAYAGDNPPTSFNEFGWSMPHLQYADVRKMLKEMEAIGNPFSDSDGEAVEE